MSQASPFGAKIFRPTERREEEFACRSEKKGADSNVCRTGRPIIALMNPQLLRALLTYARPFDLRRRRRRRRHLVAFGQKRRPSLSELQSLLQKTRLSSENNDDHWPAWRAQRKRSKKMIAPHLSGPENLNHFFSRFIRSLAQFHTPRVQIELPRSSAARVWSLLLLLFFR